MYPKCPLCIIADNVEYDHIFDLRICQKHVRRVFYDKDYGCVVCEMVASDSSKKEVPATERAQIETEKEAEVQLEASGDHGRGMTLGHGLNWL